MSLKYKLIIGAFVLIFAFPETTADATFRFTSKTKLDITSIECVTLSKNSRR